MQDRAAPVPGSKTDGSALHRFWSSWTVFWLIVLAAGAWRLVMAIIMPCMSKDGVTFAWYARDLGEIGVEYLQRPDVAQHPLFPTLILGLHRLVEAIGVEPSPLSWQWAGQSVAILAGLGVVLLAAAVTLRVVGRLGLRVEAGLARNLAALLAGVLPLNIALSADAMSDQVHLALYLLGIWCLLDPRRGGLAAIAGVAAGLAFLTRPEGAALVPAGLSVLLAMRVEMPWRRILLRAGILCLAFAAVAGPYWLAAGELSRKKNPLEWFKGEEGVTAVAPAPLVNYARLEREELPPALVVPHVVWETFRAGRVVVPLLGLAGVVVFWRRLRRPGTVALLAAFLLHGGLVTLLQWRYHYLDPRHTLVLVMLLLPLAAAVLAHWRDLAYHAGQKRAWWIGLAVALAPLVWYGLRVPNAETGHYRALGSRLREAHGEMRDVVLLSSSTEKRIAYYADCQWVRWPDEAIRSADELAALILDIKPDLFAIETGEGYEFAGNESLRLELLERPDLSERAHHIASAPNPADGRLFVYRLEWR